MRISSILDIFKFKSRMSSPKLMTTYDILEKQPSPKKHYSVFEGKANKVKEQPRAKITDPAPEDELTV